MTTLHDQWTALYAAGKVRWMPGMMDAGGRRVINAGADKDGRWARFAITGEWIVVGNDLHAITPDFNDPATIGCLLHQLNEHDGWYWIAPIDHEHPTAWAVWHTDGGPGRIVAVDPLNDIPAAILAAIAAAPPKVKP
jgi:hypothetical protein